MQIKLPKYREKPKPPKRSDILNNLPSGAMVRIAKRLGTTKHNVSNTLHGRSTQTSTLAKEILDLAQVIAAVHMWNERFNKHEITVNPLKL